MNTVCPTARGITARGVVLSLILGAMAVLFTCDAKAEVNAGRPETDIRGCWFIYSPKSGKLHPQRFIKTADKEYGSEDGEPEIWGFFVDNLPEPDEDGKIKPVNVRAAMFVPADGQLHPVPTGRTERRVKCTVWDAPKGQE